MRLLDHELALPGELQAGDQRARPGGAVPDPRRRLLDGRPTVQLLRRQQVGQRHQGARARAFQQQTHPVPAPARPGRGRAVGAHTRPAGRTRQGPSLVLIARRQEPLDALADELRAAHGVECVAASIDLGRYDACDTVIAAVGDREVGLYISNAGANPHGSRFLDKDIEAWRSLVTRNVLTTVLCVHHFATRMRERGHGGLLLVDSFACYGGGQFMACYTGSKAFDLNVAESLWSEFKSCSVDGRHPDCSPCPSGRS